jgi:GNAT superfamily N-acetyltransferase
MEYALSEIDRLRFGHAVAKASLGAEHEVERLMAQAKADRIDLLIVRVPTDQIATVQALQSCGAFLTDTLVHFQKRNIDAYDDFLPAGYSTRLAIPQDASHVEALAQEAFRHYPGHYHSDSRLDPATCDLVYSSWARDSCSNLAMATGVILIERGDHLAAFATVKLTDSSSFEGVLFGVAPRHEGKGLYLALLRLAERWGIRNELRRMSVSTQITNVTVQKAWCRLGFEPRRSIFTMHKWFSQNV